MNWLWQLEKRHLTRQKFVNISDPPEKSIWVEIKLDVIMLLQVYLLIEVTGCIVLMQDGFLKSQLSWSRSQGLRFEDG